MKCKDSHWCQRGSVVSTIIPLSIEQLLKEFLTVTKEQGTFLPSVREMDHRIYLIPGASLPNLLYYRFGFKEADILLSQMEQLLKDGLIRPSISPRAVRQYLHY